MNSFARSGSITLRRLRAGDLVAFQAYRTDPSVARYQNWSRMDDIQAAGFLRQMETEPLLNPGRWCQIAVADALSDRLLGDMGLFLSNDGAEAELGITLARSAQGHGHATTAVKLAFDLIWENSPAQIIRAWGDQRNTASLSLMRRAGMIHLGTEITDVTEEAFALHRPNSG